MLSGGFCCDPQQSPSPRQDTPVKAKDISQTIDNEGNVVWVVSV